MIKLKVIWSDKSIAIGSKIRLLRSLVMFTFVYACETWAIITGINRRIPAMEMRCFPKLLSILYLDHLANEEVKTRIGNAIWQYEDLLISEKTQTEVVQECHTIIWPGQDYPTGHSTRRETKKQTGKTIGRQHQSMDRPFE